MFVATVVVFVAVVATVVLLVLFFSLFLFYFPGLDFFITSQAFSPSPFSFQSIFFNLFPPCKIVFLPFSLDLLLLLIVQAVPRLSPLLLLLPL